MIKANPDDLGIAIAELGNNAVLYTPANGTISISTRQQGNQVVIDVRDSGIGISTTDLPHIFERLYQTDQSRSSETGEVGLGLSIAKRIIELHHGSIVVESLVGQGSLFRVLLPLSE